MGLGGGRNHQTDTVVSSPTVDERNPEPVDRFFDPSLIDFIGFQGSTIQGGAGFLPSTV